MVDVTKIKVNPYWKHLGMELSDFDGDKTVVTLDVTGNLKQIYGTVHGGVLASLVDSAIAVAIHRQLDADEGCSTVEMKLNYLRPVNGGRLTAEGRVVQRGRKIAVGQCEIRDETGQMVAFGTATFFIVKLPESVVGGL